METRLSEFKKNILIWYPFKKNSTILNIENGYESIFDELDVKFDKIVSYSHLNQNSNSSKNISNEEKFDIANKLKENEKFDYVTIIGKYNFEFEEKVRIAKSYVKDDGIVLIAIDNKFGLKNWNRSNNLKNEISKNELTNIFDKNNLKKSKFYYVFPNFKQANLIYSDEYDLTEDDISRNFSVYKKNSIVPLNENEVYKELLDQGKEFFNNFSNSFFIELSNKEINNNIKYVSFSNYRKKEYRTITIIDRERVIKKAVDKNSENHINQIANNLKVIKNNGLECIEIYEDKKIKSKFINNKRFDVELSQVKSIDEFIQKFSILSNIIMKNSIKYSELDFDGVIKDCIKNYDKEKLFKLHFLKNGLIDLVPKNCFVIDSKLYVFDQEWLEKNIPAEYIIYRCILNSITVCNKFGKEELFKAMNIIEYIDLFEELEKELSNKIFDNEVHNIFFRKYLNLKKAERQREIYEKESFNLQNRVESLEQENHSLNLELEDARTKLVDYANQLRVISNSSSWKIIQKIRKIINFFKMKNRIRLVDIIYPIGTNRRERYDNKQNVKKENQRIQDMVNATDKETAEYWLKLEKLYKKRRDELDNLVLKSDSNPYDFWLKSNDLNEQEINFQKQNYKNFAIKPKISIIVPMYNTPKIFFIELLFTLYNQTYPNWELCLADGSPQKMDYIENICNDKRIKYNFIGENKGISGNSNEALKLATGDYIALLDHDDLLPLNSLYEIVKCINENPDVEFIYTDEDKIESLEKPRYDPHFKPDFSPDFLMSGNYICHFSIFKKELMNILGGFRSKYDGAQDYDIILRACEIAKPENIKHISKILYHWRIHPGSTAGNSEAKMYAYEAGEKAIQDHLTRIGLDGIAKRDENINGFYKVKYNIIGNPKVNIIIINRNDIYYLKQCINSIKENTSYENYEIDIVDNCSDDSKVFEYYNQICNEEKIQIFINKKDSNSYLKEWKFSIYNDNISDLNYFEYLNNSKLMNCVINKIDGQFIVELDRHEKIKTKDWIQTMIGFAQRKDVGCVGAKVFYENETIKHAGIVYGIGDYAVYLYREKINGHRLRDKMICNMSVISSLCRMYRKEIFEIVQGMNENINFELINEVDFSLRIREKGFLNIYTPQVEVLDCDTFNERERIEEEDTFEYKREINQLKSNFKDIFSKTDPYHNINFSPASSNCVLRIDKI